MFVLGTPNLKFQISETMMLNPIRSEWTLVKDGSSRSFTFEHTIYSGRELKDRLVSCGFKQVQCVVDSKALSTALMRDG